MWARECIWNNQGDPPELRDRQGRLVGRYPAELRRRREERGLPLEELARETGIPEWLLMSCAKDTQADRRLRARVAQALLRWSCARPKLPHFIRVDTSRR